MQVIDTCSMIFVLLPGMDGTGELFEPFVKIASKRRTCVVVRYPSAKTLRPKEYLDLIRDYIPMTKEYVLVAESLSGSLAIEVAAQNPSPKRLRGLILVSTFARRPVGGAFLLVSKIFGPLAMRFPPPRWAVRQFLLESRSTNEEVEKVQRVISSVNGTVLWSRLKMVLNGDVTDRLSAIQAPALILGAERDRLLGPAMARSATEELANGIVGSKLVWIDGPHLLMQTRPAECLRAIEEFAS